MSEQHVDQGRRRFLTVATGALGGVAAAGVATPFVLSFFSIRTRESSRCAS